PQGLRSLMPERAQRGEVRVTVAARDEYGVVEAEVGEHAQALGGGLGIAAQVELPLLRHRRGRGLEIHRDVRGDRALAAGLAEALDAVAQRRDAAPRARADPAVEVLGLARDPAAACPRADEELRPAERGRPRVELRGADLLALPEPAHQ